MLKAVILVSVIAILLVIFYDVQQRKAALIKSGDGTLLLKKELNRKRLVRLFFFVSSVIFTVVGAWQCIEPAEPPYGGKVAVIFQLAYLTFGKYGPAMMFLAGGITCFIASMRTATHQQER